MFSTTMTHNASDEGTAEALLSRSERRCLASGQVCDKDQLLRFVIAPDGVVTPDFAGRLPGRGLWLTPSKAMVRLAMEKRLFAKAAKAKVTVPDDLLERLVALQRERVLGLLGLARRASLALAGFEKVRQALVAGTAKVLLAASDGSPDQRAKLAALAGDRVVIDCFTSVELAQALGRDTTVHVALTAGGLTDSFLNAVRRLKALRGDDDMKV